MAFLIGCATITVLTTAGIVIVLGVEAVRFFQVSGVSPLAFLTGSQIRPDANPPQYGILALVWGTAVIAVGSS